jgi:hypothetical protein
MPNIQVAGDRRREILEAHRVWASRLSREPGQIGGAIAALVEGPPVIVPLQIETYSDFDPVRFVSVDPRFVEFLVTQDIAFEEN